MTRSYLRKRANTEKMKNWAWDYKTCFKIFSVVQLIYVTVQSFCRMLLAAALVLLYFILNICVDNVIAFYIYIFFSSEMTIDTVTHVKQCRKEVVWLTLKQGWRIIPERNVLSDKGYLACPRGFQTNKNSKLCSSAKDRVQQFEYIFSN